jgi:hypothetical protein
MGSV